MKEDCEQYYANSNNSSMANKKWQFTFADFKSCSLIHTNLFRGGWDGSALYHLTFSLSFSLGCAPSKAGKKEIDSRKREDSMEINNKNCCRLKEKCRVVQLIYSGPLALPPLIPATDKPPFANSPLHPKHRTLCFRF